MTTIERLERAYTLLISSIPALWRAHRDSPNAVAKSMNAMLHDAVVDWLLAYQVATGRDDQGLTRIAPEPIP